MSSVCVSHAGVIADAPLAPRARANLVEVLLDHGIVGDPASAFVLESVAPDRLVRVACAGWMTVTPASPGVRLLQSSTPGAWLSQAFGANPNLELLVHAKSASWQGTALPESGFAYAALQRAIPVTVMNPVGPDEQLLGNFFDVITLAGKGGPDGDQLATSPLARALKKKLRVGLAFGATWF